jgi:iron complex outermembrane receptor protein
MNNQTMTSRAIYLVLAMSGAFGGAQAIAADDSNAPALQEIIVTAQKRSENLQDVPISVVAINAQQVQDAGITNIRNLAILTPGLTVTSEGNEAITTARIRGIGTVGDNPGLESSVGVNIDGVYRPRNGVAFGDLGEIEQIEVLYGPQGELFGKNNDAGVINVTTKRPENTFGAMAEVTGGNFNDREVRASVTGPLNDIMAGRLYMGFQQNDGFLQVVNGVGPSTQNNTNDRHSFNTRGQLLITPTMRSAWNPVAALWWSIPGPSKAWSTCSPRRRRSAASPVRSVILRSSANPAWFACPAATSRMTIKSSRKMCATWAYPEK